MSRGPTPGLIADLLQCEFEATLADQSDYAAELVQRLGLPPEAELLDKADDAFYEAGHAVDKVDTSRRASDERGQQCGYKTLKGPKGRTSPNNPSIGLNHNQIKKKNGSKTIEKHR